jgi:hypothetical protein
MKAKGRRNESQTWSDTSTFGNNWKSLSPSVSHWPIWIRVNRQSKWLFICVCLLVCLFRWLVGRSIGWLIVCLLVYSFTCNISMLFNQMGAGSPRWTIITQLAAVATKSTRSKSHSFAFRWALIYQEFHVGNK